MNKKFIVLLLFVIGILVGIFLLGDGSGTSETSTGVTEQNIGTKHEDQGQAHIANGAEHVPYNSNLPSSGPHYASPAPWGVKTEFLPDETLVHNLEHGGIIISYKPDLEESKVNQLKEIFENLPKSQRFGTIKAILIPRQANTHAVQLAAWTYTLDLQDVDADSINQFYSAHVDKGPELVP